MALRTSPALLALLASHALLACPSLALLPIFHDSNIVDENNLAEGMPQPLSLSDAVHLFQRLQQERQSDDVEDIMDQYGDPRLIGITDGGLYRGGECHSGSILSPHSLCVINLQIRCFHFLTLSLHASTLSHFI